MMLKDITKTVCTIARKAGKHAPAVMVVGGIAAAGATVYFAIKSKEKVDKDFEVLEDKKNNGEEVKTTEKKATTKKETAKKETKKEEKTEVKDYSKMTVAELKEIAKEKGIATTGMKKADIIEALEK